LWINRAHDDRARAATTWPSSGAFTAAKRGDGSGAILTLRFPLRAAAYNTGQPG